MGDEVRAAANDCPISHLTDEIVLNQLKAMIDAEEPITPAMLSAITTRYGKPNVAQVDERVHEDLKLVSGA
jgi:hypothetical protein